MKPLRQLAAASIAAIGVIGTSAGTAGALPPAPRPVMARFEGGTVVSLSVVPTSGRADVVVGVDGNVSLKHFTLKKPDRIVVDIGGATLGLSAGDSYDGVARGGITRVAYSQFSKSV